MYIVSNDKAGASAWMCAAVHAMEALDKGSGELRMSPVMSRAFQGTRQ